MVGPTNPFVKWLSQKPFFFRVAAGLVSAGIEGRRKAVPYAVLETVHKKSPAIQGRACQFICKVGLGVS